MLFLDSIAQLLSTLPEAAMLFKDGVLLLANPPARALLGGKNQLEEILDGKTLPAQGILTECCLGGTEGFLYVNDMDLGDSQGLLLRFSPTPPEEEPAAMKGLLGSVSNELRESTSIISMAVDLLLPQIENCGNAKLNSYLAMLSQHQRRVQRIAGNLGAFCDLMDKNLSMELSKFDLVDLCAGLITEVAGLGDNKDRKISFRCSLNTLYTLGDMEKVKRLLLNLISNSMKHTPPDGEIQLSLSQSEDRIHLTLSDNGAGMPPEVLSRVFRCFEKHPLYLAEGIGSPGLGLGLSLCHGIARLHGGTLMVESRPGQGTRVTATLRRWPDQELALHEEVQPYGPAVQRILLTELSDVLSHNEYMPRYLD